MFRVVIGDVAEAELHWLLPPVRRRTTFPGTAESAIGRGDRDATHTTVVMAGLVPAIHVFTARA
jgi:hypothetical protein